MTFDRRPTSNSDQTCTELIENVTKRTRICYLQCGYGLGNSGLVSANRLASTQSVQRLRYSRAMTTTSNDDDRLSHRRVQLYRSDATVPCRRIVANSLRDSIAERCNIRQCHISSVCLTVCLSHSSVMFNEKGWTRNRTAFTILFFCNSSIIEKKTAKLFRICFAFDAPRRNRQVGQIRNFSQ